MSPDNERRILAALERLESGQAQMTGRLERLETGQAQMREDMTRLEAGQAQLHEDLVRRLDQLQETADAIRADIAAHNRTD